MARARRSSNASGPSVLLRACPKVRIPGVQSSIPAPSSRLGARRFVSSERDVLARLRDTLRSPRYEPPMLPGAIFELLELSKQPDASYQEILALAESDPLIAAKVLRVAQSPLYQRGEPVRSLGQALSRLGTSTLAALFMQVATTTRVFRAQGYAAPMQALREHAVAVAHASRLVAEHAGLDADMAFLCGLLHDIGTAMCLIVLGDVRVPELPPPFESVRRAVLSVQGEATALLCRRWGISPEIAFVLSQRTAPSLSEEPHPVTSVMLLGDELATREGFSSPVDSPYCHELVANALMIDESTWSTLKERFAALAPVLR